MSIDVGLNRIRASEHRLNQVVDESFSVSPISSHLEGMTLGVESSSGASKLEGPQEVVGFLEVLAAAGDLVDEVLDGVDLVLSEDLLHDVVVFEGNSLSVDLAVTSLEDELPDGILGRVTIGDVGLNSSEHIDGGFVQLDEDTVVDLSESEESHDSDGLGVEFVNTSDSNHKGDFGFSRYVDLTGELSLN
jgi:hypothetical protein